MLTKRPTRIDMPFGHGAERSNSRQWPSDHLGHPIDDLDRRLVVDRVPGAWSAGPPTVRASAVVFSGRSGLSRCGKISKSTNPGPRRRRAAVQAAKMSATAGEAVTSGCRRCSPPRTRGRGSAAKTANPVSRDPAIEVDRVAAVHEQDIGLLAPTEPTVRSPHAPGRSRELKDTTRTSTRARPSGSRAPPPAMKFHANCGPWRSG